MRKLLAAVLFIGLSLTASAQKYGKVVDKTVAVVGNEVIMVSDIEQEVQMMRAQGLSSDRNLRCELLEQMMVQKIFLMQARLDSLSVNQDMVDGELAQRVDQIRTSLGGRASEIVYYGTEAGVSTGASGDLASATELAGHIICTYGMDEEFGLSVVQKPGEGELSPVIRDAVNDILAREMKEAIRLIEENRPAIDALVDELLKKTHLTGGEIGTVLEANAKRAEEK